MIKEFITKQKETLNSSLSSKELALGEIIFNNGQCQLLSQSVSKYELILADDVRNEHTQYTLCFTEEGTIVPKLGADEEVVKWNEYSYACLLQIENELHILDPKKHPEHKKYTRQGMIKRVLNERRLKAEKAGYHIQWADNVFGDHVLTNEKGVKYKILLRDFENETGYSNSMDARLNKLGTTKHIMFAFKALKEDKKLYDELSKTYPFIEVFCDPLNDYRITWYYPHYLSVDEQLLISRFFKKASFIEDDKVAGLLEFIEDARKFPNICIRPEVTEKIEAAFEKQMLERIAEKFTPDFSGVKTELYPYQKEGVQFALFRKNAIIADEMGLGKTIQAIVTAAMKKEVFGFKKTLVICPASLKEQWKKEIEKFTDEKALIVQGFPNEREKQYLDNEHFFYIINYETVLRDAPAINRAGMDFLILDEVQRAKNYETKTANSLKTLEARHKLAITGTPIENRLIDIFSVMGILEPTFFGPLWEFSYQHCLFDPEKYNKINGYYNLQKLNKKLEEVLIRREKYKVIDQLPNLVQISIPVKLSPLQADMHASFAKSLSYLIRKKFLTPYDLQRIMLLLSNMRMVCDSTYLIDDHTHESPKLDELKHILVEKLDVPNKEYKIIIFSEWVKVHKLIGKMLRDNNIGFVELNGTIPVKTRGELIRKFEKNPQYKVFLSTEAGGTGLNLQVANTLINFELPWNPARKNQRIGRIDRIGQKSAKLTIYNFITKLSIEEQIASGLIVKQNLFDGVLKADFNTDFVDFSSKGRSQFIEQIEMFLDQMERREAPQEEEQLIEKLQEILPEPAVDEPSPDEIDLTGDESESLEKSTETQPPQSTQPGSPKVEELEQVMNSGLQFLSGLFKMSTGKDIGMENQKIEINKETGEVTMKFKLPILT
jgi:SNF2 family DNA or RNA helicase